MSKWIKCKKCGREYDNSIKQCPICYTKTPLRLKDIVTAVVVAVLVIGTAVGIYLALTDDGGAGNVSSGASSVSSVMPSSSSEVSSAASSPTSSDRAPSAASSRQSQSSSSVNYKQPTDGDGNIKVSSTNGTVQITMPKWLLLLTEPDFDYTLTDTEKNEYNFTGITKNSDGSATYSIGYNDYHRFRLIFGSSTTASVTDFKKLSTVRKVDYNEGYGKVKIYTTYSTVDELDDRFSAMLLVAGLKTTTYQYFSAYDSIGTDIEIYDKNDNLIGVSKYPDVLKK
jgi:hypothetical protein